MNIIKEPQSFRKNLRISYVNEFCVVISMFLLKPTLLLVFTAVIWTPAEKKRFENPKKKKRKEVGVHGQLQKRKITVRIEDNSR